MAKTKMRNKKMQNMIQTAVNEAFTQGFKSVLNDISYRIGVMYDTKVGNRITSEMLNIPMPILDGFVITDNSPAAGSVAWSDCHVMYKGTNVTITDGNTALKYVWWDFSALPNTVFQSSATKPILTDDDILICVNNAGIHQMVIGEGRMTSGATLLDGTVTGSEVSAGAITTAKLATGAVDSTILGTGAVTSGKILAGAVDSTALGSNAVTSVKIAADAVTSAAIATGAVIADGLASNAVTATAIASGAVVSGKLGTGAVVSTNLAADSVTSSAIATGAVIADGLAANAVTSTALATGAVTSGKIGADAVTNTAIATGAVNADSLSSGAVTSVAITDGAIIAAKIGAGAVATDKLNIATHLLF